VKLKIRMGTENPLGLMDGEKKSMMNNHVCVQKIQNGYILTPMGDGPEGAKYIKTLDDSPVLLSKLFGIENKNAKQIEDMKEKQEKEED